MAKTNKRPPLKFDLEKALPVPVPAVKSTRSKESSLAEGEQAPINTRVPADLYREVRILAIRQNRLVRDVIKDALRAYVAAADSAR